MMSFRPKFEFKDKETTFEESVVKQISKCVPKSDILLMTLRRLHKERTGEIGLSVKDLNSGELRFPYNIRTTPLSKELSLSRVLSKFTTTELHDRWNELSEIDMDWDYNKALVFTAKQWGNCVLLEDHLPISDTIDMGVIHIESNGLKLTILELATFVQMSEWLPTCCAD